MSENKDIRLEFHFKYEDRLPAGLFARFIQVAEQSIYEVELEGLVEVSVTFPEISRIDLDAVRYRMDHSWGRSLQLEDVYTGSIILSGLAAGLAFWVLDQTLCESQKDVWPGSELRQRVKDFLINEPMVKARLIAARIDEKVKADLYLRQYEMQLEYNVYESGFEAVVFTVDVLSDDQTPPSLGEIE